MRKRVKCLFRLDHPTAEQVFVLGEFNRWSTHAAPMERGEGGRWEAVVELPPGRHAYCYIAYTWGEANTLRSELIWSGRVVEVPEGDAGEGSAGLGAKPQVCLN